MIGFFAKFGIDLPIVVGIALAPQIADIPQSMNRVVESEGQRYIVERGEVYDKETDLTWKRCSCGQKWTESLGCVGVIWQMTWEVAMSQAQYSWRVPTKEELSTLIAPLRHSPAIDEVLFPDMEPLKLWYWSSSESESDGSAWYVAFGNGTIHEGRRGDFNSVRLVRSGRGW